MYDNNETNLNENSELFELFARAQWLMHRYHQVNHHKHGPMGDPHRGQGRVLTLLKMQPEISQKDLGYLLGMRPQSLSELLTKLEQGGYIVRTVSEADKRVMNITLTDEGKAASEDMQKPEQGGVFDCLNEEEQAAFADYLKRIISGLEAQFSEDDARGNFGWQGGRGRMPFDRDDRRGPEFGHRGGGRGRMPFGEGEGRGPEFGGWHGRGGMGRPPFEGRERGEGKQEEPMEDRGCDRRCERRGFGPDGMRRDGRFQEL